MSHNPLAPRRGRAVRLAFFTATLLWLASGASALDGAAYRARFPGRWAEAERLSARLGPILLDCLDGDGALAGLGMAVVFPELTRYSCPVDLAQAAALELSWSLGGRADFSVGKAQMKPSFAEAMEDLAGEADRARHPRLFPAGRGGRTERSRRLGRLRDDTRQMEYLALFLHLMLDRFPSLAGGGEESLRVLATAYNAGYGLGWDELEARSSLEYFPWGPRHRGRQFSFSAIALERYLEAGPSSSAGVEGP